MPVSDMAQLISQSDISDDICLTTYQTDRWGDGTELQHSFD